MLTCEKQSERSRNLSLRTLSPVRAGRGGERGGVMGEEGKSGGSVAGAAAKQTELPKDGDRKIQGRGGAERRDEIGQERVGDRGRGDTRVSEGGGAIARGARQRVPREMLPRSPSPPQPDAPAATASNSAARADAYAGEGEGGGGGAEYEPSAPKLWSTPADPAVATPADPADPAVALPRARAPRIKESPKELLVYSLAPPPPLLLPPSIPIW